MTTAIFRQLAAYNQWANARLYTAALGLSEEDYRRPTGVFFKSLHGTLNHLLVTDRLWLRRLTGEGDVPDRLDAIIHDDRHDLALARAEEDKRLLAVIAGYDKGALAHLLHPYPSTGWAVVKSGRDCGARTSSARR